MYPIPSRIDTVLQAYAAETGKSVDALLADYLLDTYTTALRGTKTTGMGAAMQAFFIEFEKNAEARALHKKEKRREKKQKERRRGRIVDSAFLHRNPKLKSGFHDVIVAPGGFRARVRTSRDDLRAINLRIRVYADEAASDRYNHYKKEKMTYGPYEALMAAWFVTNPFPAWAPKNSDEWDAQVAYGLCGELWGYMNMEIMALQTNKKNPTFGEVPALAIPPDFTPEPWMLFGYDPSTELRPEGRPIMPQYMWKALRNGKPLDDGADDPAKLQGGWKKWRDVYTARTGKIWEEVEPVITLGPTGQPVATLTPVSKVRGVDSPYLANALEARLALEFPDEWMHGSPNSGEDGAL